jgi:hypothetical protein
VPLLLRITEKFNKAEKAEELGKALWALECSLFRAGTICSVSINELESVLGEAARIVSDNQRPDSEFVAVLEKARPDAEFKEAFKTFSAKGKLAFYIAWRSEKFALGDGSGLDIGSLSPAKQSYQQHLEHIMPKQSDED